MRKDEPCALQKNFYITSNIAILLKADALDNKKKYLMTNHQKNIWQTVWNFRIESLLFLSLIALFITILETGTVLHDYANKVEFEPFTGLQTVFAVISGLILLIHSLNAFLVGFYSIMKNHGNSTWQALYKVNLIVFCVFSLITAVIVVLGVVIVVYDYANKVEQVLLTEWEIVFIVIFELIFIIHFLNALFIGFYEIRRKKSLSHSEKNEKEPARQNWLKILIILGCISLLVCFIFITGCITGILAYVSEDLSSDSGSGLPPLESYVTDYTLDPVPLLDEPLITYTEQMVCEFYNWSFGEDFDYSTYEECVKLLREGHTANLYECQESRQPCANETYQEFLESFVIEKLGKLTATEKEACNFCDGTLGKDLYGDDLTYSNSQDCGVLLRILRKNEYTECDEENPGYEQCQVSHFTQRLKAMMRDVRLKRPYNASCSL